MTVHPGDIIIAKFENYNCVINMFSLRLEPNICPVEGRFWVEAVFPESPHSPYARIIGLGPGDNFVINGGRVEYALYDAIRLEIVGYSHPALCSFAGINNPVSPEYESENWDGICVCGHDYIHNCRGNCTCLSCNTQARSDRNFAINNWKPPHESNDINRYVNIPIKGEAQRDASA